MLYFYTINSKFKFKNGVKPILKSNSLRRCRVNSLQTCRGVTVICEQGDVLIYCRGELVIVIEETQLLKVAIIILGVMSISYYKLHITPMLTKKTDKYVW